MERAGVGNRAPIVTLPRYLVSGKMFDQISGRLSKASSMVVGYFVNLISGPSRIISIFVKILIAFSTVLFILNNKF